MAERIDWIAHKADPFAHHNSHFGTGSGSDSGIHTVQVDIDQPDLLEVSLSRMLHAHADWAPQGIKLKTVLIDTGESSTYSVDFEIRTTTTDASGTPIATVATSASLLAETSILTNDFVAVGSYVYAVLPATDVNKLGLEVNFEII